jgi:hypothetical protein
VNTLPSSHSTKETRMEIYDPSGMQTNEPNVLISISVCFKALNRPVFVVFVMAKNQDDYKCTALLWLESHTLNSDLSKYGTSGNSELQC